MVTELDLRFNSKYQDGPLSFDYQRESLFLTRSSNKLDKNNKIQLDLFQLPFEEIEKKIPSPLSINVDGYSTLHPSISPDGKRLYFASDRPGGFGGMDLYFVTLEKGSDRRSN
jgi:Tol biopolymer transport system component